MESLEILNGKMSPKFDKNNDIYTVNVSSDVSFLEIKYEVSDNEIVNIFGNVDLQEGINKIILSLKQDDEINYYNLIVNKEKIDTVMNNVEDFVALETSNYEKPKPYQYYSIILMGIIIVIFFYYIIFKKCKQN